MAKPRKQKNNEGQKGSTSNASAAIPLAVVRHQKLCLSIDMEQRRIYGHTELKVLVPKSGVIGLHANSMNIDNVFLNGLPVRFKFYSQHQQLEIEKNWGSITCIDAAEAAGSTYFSSLEREMAPDLLIFCGKATSAESAVQEPADTEKVGQTIPCNPDTVNKNAQQENVKLVRIEYWLEKPEVGVHFMGSSLHTNNQLRRARCWFPCIDSGLQRCCYDLEFTVGSKYVAVSNGTLLYQVISKDDPPCKTYVYCVNVPVAAEFITLAVAPFEVLPDRHNGVVSHMCMPSNLSKLQCTVSFFHNVFSYYEEYLAAAFPFGSYKQVFIDSETASSSACVGASMSIFSSHLLYDERVIDQVISTRIKLAYALAQQWFGIYITAETANDGWLLDGLAGFLTDCFIKRFLGNNEARYRRYKANEAVCKVDVDGATALSLSGAAAELYRTQAIGVLGKIRSWKAVAILQMLEKQMGPESFRKILQRIVHKAEDVIRASRTLSTKEFRHLANKVGNLERPFLKEFFPRWVESCGCPVLRMGLSYNKRRNMIELAVLRGCTSNMSSNSVPARGTVSSEFQAGDDGWPGMMSVRVYELDGMYDHPSLPMAGDTCQLLEIQCHSKLAARRIQRPKKGGKGDGSDDNGEVAATLDSRTGLESPLLWLRADPEMEYLADIQIHQPVQMWISQLEKEKDVVAQLKAIATLCSFPRLSFSIVNALNSCLIDPKVFWRVRIESAFALAKTATEETDWAGLMHLIKFYKSRRFDPDIGLPRPNDYHDFSEYFVLEAVPSAIAMVRGRDGKSPSEAINFILQLLKYNDNSGNSYSDVYWLAALVDSIGKIEFGQQSIQALLAILKRINSLLQFDRLMPSHNGVLTISCIRTLTQVALKLSHFVPLERLEELIKPFQDAQSTPWQIRLETIKALIDLETHKNGLDVALSSAVQLIVDESSLQVQTKAAMHCLHLCQMKRNLGNSINNSVLSDLLHLLESRKAFVNVNLRHHIFCVLQTLAGRSATLFGVPKPKTLIISEKAMDVEKLEEQKAKSGSMKIRFSRCQEANADHVRVNSEALNSLEAVKEMDATVSCSSGGNERKLHAVKLRIKPPEAVEDEKIMDTTRGGGPDERSFPVYPVASSSMSEAGLRVDATQGESPYTLGGEAVEVISVLESEQKAKEGPYASHANGSRLNVSTSSGTVDSMNIVSVKSVKVCSPSSVKNKKNLGGRPRNVEALHHNKYFPVDAEDYDDCESQQHGSLLEGLKKDQLAGQSDLLMTEDTAEKMDSQEKRQKDRKDKEVRKDRKKKREKEKHKDGADGHSKHRHDKHNDPEYLERKRRKKEQRRHEKGQLHLQTITNRESSADVQKPESSSQQRRPEPAEANSLQWFTETAETSSVQSRFERRDASSIQRLNETTETSSLQKIRIKIKNRGGSNC